MFIFSLEKKFFDLRVYWEFKIVKSLREFLLFLVKKYFFIFEEKIILREQNEF